MKVIFAIIVVVAMLFVPTSVVKAQLDNTPSPEKNGDIVYFQSSFIFDKCILDISLGKVTDQKEIDRCYSEYGYSIWGPDFSKESISDFTFSRLNFRLNEPSEVWEDPIGFTINAELNIPITEIDNLTSKRQLYGSFDVYQRIENPQYNETIYIGEGYIKIGKSRWYNVPAI